MFQVQAQRAAMGDECWAMWGRGREATGDHELNFGTALDVYADAARTRLDDRAGFHSKAATKRLLARLDEIDPDIVHLHNLHGYYVNVEMLFAWLAASRCQVFWTLHDCWAFTGHCTHFTFVGCDQWKTGCPGAQESCPQKGMYPASRLVDASARNYADKKRIFTALPIERMTIVTPSRWLADLVGQSFLARYPIEVHPNTVDTTVFKPTQTDFRERYNLKGKLVVLGVANPWTERKGLADFVHLRERLGDRFAIVLVGLSPQQVRSLPAGIVALERVEPAELAGIYSAADVLFNPSIEETYGLTIAEAASCGTCSIVYAGGACAETAEGFGQLVANDFEEVVALLNRWGEDL